MDYQEAIEIIEYASAFNSENSRLTKALSVAITAMQELQSLHEQGISLERLKDIDFRKEVIEHINYMEYMSIKDELEEYKQLGTLEEVREAVERQKPRKPILKNGKSGMFADYADGHGEYKVTKWQDWCCPACGWFVGQRYNASQSKSHDQRKSNYCNECGQHIDWSEEND